MLQRRRVAFSITSAGLLAALGLNALGCFASPGEKLDSRAENVGVAEDAITPNPDYTCTTVRGQPRVKDTYDLSTAEDANFGAYPYLWATNDSTGIREGLLEFDLDGVLPLGASLYTAELSLHRYSDTGSGTLNVFRATEAWSESTVTYNTKPDFFLIPLRSMPFAGMDVVQLDITSSVSAWLTGPNYGLRLWTASGERFNAHTSEGADSHLWPALTICYKRSPCESAPDNSPCSDNAKCVGSGVCSKGVCVGSPAAAGTVCRASTGLCDQAETCDGSHTGCPVNTLSPPGTVCRAAAGVCDAAETCSGQVRRCPADKPKPAGTVCRAAAGACDVAEVCDGSQVTCPADVKKKQGTLCRPLAGQCDFEDLCDGASAACPPDEFRFAGNLCGSSGDGVCHLQDTCTGTSPICQVNLAPDGTPCGSNGVCSSGTCVNETTCGTDAHPCCNGACPASTDNYALTCQFVSGIGDTCLQCGSNGHPPCPPGMLSTAVDGDQNGCYNLSNKLGSNGLCGP